MFPCVLLIVRFIFPHGEIRGACLPFELLPIRFEHVHGQVCLCVAVSPVPPLAVRFVLPHGDVRF